MADIFNLSDTWNDGATTFSAIKMNVTDTASASGSLLMDLQVGGSSKFSVAKNGQVGAASYSGATGGFSAIVFHGSVPSSANGAVRDGIGFVTRANSTYSWVSDTNAGSGTVDLSLFRDAADTLAQRRSTNPQAFRISNTHTDLSNYERGKIAWESNVLRIGTEKAGTGSARALELQTDGVTRVTIGTTGAISTTNTLTITPPSTSGYGVTVTGGGVGGNLRLRNGTGFGFIASSTLNYGWSSDSDANSYDIALARSAAGVAKVTDGSTGGGSLEFAEQTAPAAPAANGVRIYAEDDGAGKTRLMALFATGSAVQIAIEP